MASRTRIRAVIAGMVVAVAATSSSQAAAPSGASCAGQFFSSHAGIVPATGGEESVGGFVSDTAREDGRVFGQEISGSTSLPREDCGL
jgi:expansin (peptidoglycan-binding protein)